MDELMVEWMGRWQDKQVDGYKGRWLGGQMDAWMEGGSRWVKKWKMNG